MVSGELIITIDASAFEDALEAFTERAKVLIAEAAESLALNMRNEVVKAIGVQVDGRLAVVTIKTESDARPPT